MVSDSQSAPIRANGGRLKIRGHPAPRVGEFADRGGWRTTEGADLRRTPSSEDLRVRQVFGGRNLPSGGGSPIWGTASPAHPSAPGADWSGDWGECARGDSLPEHSSPVFRPFWQLIGVTADELPRNSGPGTRISKTPPPATPPIRVDRGFFSAPDRPQRRRGPPFVVSPRYPPFSVAGSALPPIRKSEKAVFPRPPIGAEADGVPIPGTLPRRDRLSETPRVPLDGNPLGIGVSADAAGWVARLGHPAVPPPRPPARRWPPPSPSGASKRSFPLPFSFCRPSRGGTGGDCAILRVSRPPVRGIRETRRHGHGADLRALAARKASRRARPLSRISTRQWR